MVVSREGVLVQKWGDFRGWVSKSQLSTETIEYPKKMLRLGQAVKCGVIVWDKTWDWISLSLVPMGRRESSTQVLQLGKMYTATVVKVGEEGVEPRG